LFNIQNLINIQTGIPTYVIEWMFLTMFVIVNEDHVVDLYIIKEDHVVVWSLVALVGN